MVFVKFCVIFSLVIIFNSCKKDSLPLDDSLKSSINVEHLKMSFRQNDLELSDKSNWLSELKPNWENVQLFDSKLQYVYEIELKNPKNVFSATREFDIKEIKNYANKSVLKLIILENKIDKKLTSTIIEIASFKENTVSLYDLHYMDYKEYTGAINFYYLNGELSNGWLYKSGKIIAKTDNRIKNAIPIKLEGKSNSTGKSIFVEENPIICGSISIPHWRQTCITVGGVEGWGYDGTGGTTVCNWEVYHTTEIIYCPTQGDGPDGGGGYTGGGGGGSGGGNSGDPNTGDPDCDKKTKIQTRSANQVISSQTNEIRQNSTTNEYGAEQNLTSLTGTPVYKNIPVRTNTVPSPNSFDFTFTWNSTDGYTIGFNHGHPGNTAHSPADIFIAAQVFELNNNLNTSSASVISFFKENVSITVTTSNGTYVVTIKDWTSYYAAYNTYKNNALMYNSNWLQNGAGKPLGYSLLSTLGDSVNLHYAESSNNNYKTLKLNNDDNIIAVNPCDVLTGPIE